MDFWMNMVKGIPVFAWLIGSFVASGRAGWCKCYRHRKYYFKVLHDTTRVMALDAVCVTLLSVYWLFLLDLQGAIIWGVMGVWHIRRVWFHDKDKIKRNVKALGRVVVKDNGRLAVEA